MSAEATVKLKFFKVATVSSNRNGFGLVGMVLMGQDGEAWEVGANDLNARKKGDVLSVRVTDSGQLDWSGLGFEIPRELKPSAPPEVVKEVWG